MNTSTEEVVAALTDQEAILACRSLAVLLDLQLSEEPNAQRPQSADTSDLNRLVQEAGQPIRNLESSLEEADDQEAASGAAARGMLMICTELGYDDQVRQACEAAKTHVRDLGLVSGPIIIAALAAVIAWVPVEQKKRVKQETIVGADGSIMTSTEEETSTTRVGATALQALRDWWIATV